MCELQMPEPPVGYVVHEKPEGEVSSFGSHMWVHDAEGWFCAWCDPDNVNRFDWSWENVLDDVWSNSILTTEKLQ